MLSLSNGRSSRSLAISAQPFRRGRPRSLAVVAAALGLVVLAACSGSNSPGASGGGKVVPGATVTFALTPGAPPNYIFPMYPIADWGPQNLAELQNFLYPPLYWYGQGNSPLEV